MDENKKGRSPQMTIGLLFLLWAGGLFCFLISCYLSVTIYIGSFAKEKPVKTATQFKRFAVVVPAHNEAAGIENTLRSIMDVDYPKPLFDIYVIADNCTDNTAEIVRGMSISCLERNDTEKFGKGYALKWFFEYAITRSFPHDAFLVIDADTLVDKNIISAMNTGLCNGREVLTSQYNILRPDSSVTRGITFIALLLRNLKNKGLDYLGGSAQLLGNGMCFTMDVIKKYGWDTSSITEDREKWASLYLAGVNVGLVDETSIYAVMPNKFKAYGVPRARWDIGNFEVNRIYFPAFLKVFLNRKNVASLFMLLELIAPPTTYFFLINMFFLTIVVIAFLLYKAGIFILGLWTVNISLFSVSIITGILKKDVPLALLRRVLLYLPFYGLWRIWNLFRGYIKNRRREWIRSDRE